MKVTIGHLYPEYLNLYGDNGNVEVLVYRASQRNIDIQVVDLSLGSVSSGTLDDIDILFMGGGPDSCQTTVYQDFVEHKKAGLTQHILEGKPALFICGAYQLLGNYYKGADGSVLDGLGVLDFYTEHPGKDAKRCIGNVEAKLSEELLRDGIFIQSNVFGDSIVGFENHGGRTFLGKGVQPLGYVIKGFGNNQQDGTEGILYKNCIGTYLHGPFLAKNPHIADFLLAKALKVDTLSKLDDKLEIAVHTASKMLKQ
ncbi:MAG: glutamine amidotransferase [Patescibacteria group bacterium]|jgi:hypothetical protein